MLRMEATGGWRVVRPVGAPVLDQGLSTGPEPPVYRFGRAGTSRIVSAVTIANATYATVNTH